MINLLYSFFYPLVHPYRCYREIEAKKDLSILSMDSFKNTAAVNVDFNQSLILAWISKIISGLYLLLAINLGVLAYNSFWGNFPDTIFNISSSGVLILFILQIVFFPLVLWVYLRIWGVLFKVFAILFAVEGDIERKINQILWVSISASALLLIPVYGSFLQKFYRYFLFFSGLRSNLGLSFWQSILTLMIPLFIMFLPIISLMLLAFASFL